MRFCTIATAMVSLCGLVSADVNTTSQNCGRSDLMVAPGSEGLGWDITDDSHYFCEAGWVDGEVLTGIRAWRGDWALYALQFKWGDNDWGKIYGDYTDGKKTRDPTQELVWDAGDSVAIKIAANVGRNWKHKVAPPGVGRIQVWINNENKLDRGSKYTDRGLTTFDFGSKKIMALSGKAQSQAGLNKDGKLGIIETLQFNYLESNLKRTTMTDMVYSEDINKYNAEKKGIDNGHVLGTSSWVNSNPKGGYNQTWGASNTFSYTNTQSFMESKSHSVTFAIHETITYGGTMPVFQAGGEWGWSLSYDYTTVNQNTVEHGDTRSVTYTVGASYWGVPPQTYTQCIFTAVSGTFESPFTAKMTVILANGKSWIFRTSGQAKSVVYVNVTYNCKDTPVSQVPPEVLAAALGNGTDIKNPPSLPPPSPPPPGNITDTTPPPPGNSTNTLPSPTGNSTNTLPSPTENSTNTPLPPTGNNTNTLPPPPGNSTNTLPSPTGNSTNTLLPPPGNSTSTLPSPTENSTNTPLPPTWNSTNTLPPPLGNSTNTLPAPLGNSTYTASKQNKPELRFDP